jgi:Mn2+/Fe2+ NRAMP family transporter
MALAKAEPHGEAAIAPMIPSKPISWVRRVLKIFGAGLVTGAADDDPSGIATYSSVGAQFGYGMLWTMPLIYPFMAVTQEISARLGRVTGRGIAGNIRDFYPAWMLYIIVLSLLFANIINIGADNGAMGAAVNLLVGGPTLLYCLFFTIISVLLEVYISYGTYSAALKWLTLSLFAYVGTIFVVQVDWTEALKGTFFPDISLKRESLAALVPKQA